MERCDVGRGSLAVRVLGPHEAPGVLLVAGGGGAMWTWSRLVPELHPPAGAVRLWPIERPLSTDLRIAVFDQAGVGGSVDVPPATSVDEAARDALHVGRSVLGDRFAVAGISLGGAVAMRLALMAAEHVTGLVVACSFASVSTFVASSATATVDRAPDDDADRSFGVAFRDREPEMVAEVRRLDAGSVVSDAVESALVDVFLSHDGHRLERIAAPTTVVCGDQDRVFPSANSELVASLIPDSTLRLVAGAGHALHIEAPEELAAAIRQRANR